MIPRITELPTPDPRIRLFRSDPEVDCFAVVSQRYLVIVDTFGTPEEAQQMMGLLEPALKGRQLLVINTHQHYDHTWGNAVFAEDGPYPAPIIAYQKSVEMLTSKGHEAQQYLSEKQAQDPRFANVQIVVPTLSFSDRFAIHGGDLTLELLPAPGHCEDQIVVWIPEIKVLLAADALEFPFPYAAEAADLPVLLQTMHQLKSLEAQTILPCHGGLHGPALIEQNLAYFARIREACEQAIQHIPEQWQALDLTEMIGLSYPEVLEQLDLKADPTSAFYLEFHRRNVYATMHLLQHR